MKWTIAYRRGKGLMRSDRPLEWRDCPHRSSSKSQDFYTSRLPGPILERDTDEIIRISRLRSQFFGPSGYLNESHRIGFECALTSRNVALERHNLALRTRENFFID